MFRIELDWGIPMMLDEPFPEWEDFVAPICGALAVLCFVGYTVITFVF